MSDDLPKAPEEALPSAGAAPGEPEAIHAGGPAPAGEPASAPRRRGRTATLIAAAAALGLVGGACGGFLVQADREPTALPSLTQPELKQAGGEGPDPLPAAQDRKVRTDGDLRDLLVKAPKGAKDVTSRVTGDGWMEMPEFADTFEEPADAFSDRVIGSQIRRIAVAYWERGHQFTEVRLAQFRHEENLEAAVLTDRQNNFTAAEPVDSWPLPGTGDGMVHVLSRPERKAGYLPVYEARAFAHRGDISLQIWITDTRPVPKKTIMDLAERQMERL
ncbi:hypothetical protein [Streptomyces sp. MJP52]|uniref:hypothetical protein n=1 Tax=Streptomyces sp. MJP52 TaxID=2940555 RepID=UPI0024740FA3|nr:hypothetical protein [Streptomyces sp. MJP52]MDH6226308.1 hypothetical protein [Streptomyces sp. MJP52]